MNAPADDAAQHSAGLARRLELTAAAAELGIWSRDLQTLQGTWNAQMYLLFDRDPALGPASREEWLQTIHPDDRERLAASSDELLSARGRSLEHDYRVVHRDGSVRWLVQRARFEASAGPAMIFGVTFDVTDRVRTEAALRRANERVALTTHSVGLGIWEWNSSNGEASWDATMFRLRGLEPRPVALNAQERLAITHPYDRERVAAALQKASATRVATAYEFRVVWPDGSVHWLASHSTPISDPDPATTRFIGVNWDVTAQVQARADREEKLLAERESQAKSAFLARMSHELRTPLNAVLGFAQLLQHDETDTSSPLYARIHHIRSAGEHLLSLVNDVLELSNIDSDALRLDIAAVPVSALVQNTLPLVESLALAHQVTLHVGALEGSVMADATRLRQVLLNLLSNAIKYNRPQGEVRVDSRIDSAAERGDRVILRVGDTGRGIAAPQLQQVFEPFNRLGMEHAGIQGTGIGLTIVKALVERMHGRITVHSEPGRGSQFEICLPRAAEVAEPAPTEAPALPSATMRHGRLLYIEDNPVNVLLIEELIASQTSLSLVSQPNGALGVQAARALQPDLVLVDMQLPDFDGFEVLSRLRADPATAGLRCVALSANAMPEDIERALTAGFADYWTKPIDFKAFLAALAKMLPAVDRNAA